MVLLDPPPGWTARALAEADLPALQQLCGECGDYYQLVYGAPAGPDEARTLISELPPEKTLSDKFFLGVFDSTGMLRGAIDLVRDYRDPGEWFLGLLLLSPPVRRARLGAELLESIVVRLKEIEVVRIRLACAEQNVEGLRFWMRHGFEEERRHPPGLLGVRLTVLCEMVREL